MSNPINALYRTRSILKDNFCSKGYISWRENWGLGEGGDYKEMLNKHFLSD